jgi:hypothetical protein
MGLMYTVLNSIEEIRGNGGQDESKRGIRTNPSVSAKIGHFIFYYSAHLLAVMSVIWKASVYKKRIVEIVRDN